MLKIATTGASGMLGRALFHVLDNAGCDYYPIDTSRAGCEFLPVQIDETDITNRSAIIASIADIRPDVVVNCAAYTNVDGCETEKETAFAVNAEGAGNVAAAAQAAGALMIHISTDYVFDGWSGIPYTEKDRTNPQGVYGQSKLEGEFAVIREAKNYFILRTAWLYGEGGKNFVDTIKNVALEREELSVVNDQTGSPTYTGHLAAAIARIIKIYVENRTGKPGIYHVTGSGFCTWFDFAKKIISIAPGKVKNIKPITTGQLDRPAPRPQYSMLSNDKVKTQFGVALPHWEDALAEYLS